jgi:hypothetical protein
VSYWTARLRLRDETYRQHRIGLTEDNSETGHGFSFEEACVRAQTWFRTTPLKTLASDARRRAPRRCTAAKPRSMNAGIAAGDRGLRAGGWILHEVWWRCEFRVMSPTIPR